MSKAKSIGFCCLIWLGVIYFGVALYGRISGVGTTAFYSPEIDATCAVKRTLDNMAMSCLEGNRTSLEQPK